MAHEVRREAGVLCSKDQEKEVYQKQENDQLQQIAKISQYRIKDCSMNLATQKSQDEILTIVVLLELSRNTWWK